MHLLPFTTIVSSSPPAYEQPITSSTSPDSSSSSSPPSSSSSKEHCIDFSPPIYISERARQAQANKKALTAGMYAIPRDRSVAKTRSGSFGFGKQAVELSVNVADNLLFLYPNSEEGNYTDDSERNGQRPRATFIVSITLSIAQGIPRPPPIESLTVQLKGLETLGFPQGGMEQNIILYATKKVEEARDLELLPGSAYRWEVPIEVGHDVAPYERMQFGRVFQKMSVHLKWCTKAWISKYKNLSVERDVWMTCIPRLSNMLDYSRTHRTNNENLGPLTIHIRSHHLTVGSYLRLGLYLPLLNQQDCKVIRLQLSLIQETLLHSRKRSGTIYRNNNPQHISFLKVEGDEFYSKMQENLYSNWVARIPSCHEIRPSTLSGSNGAAIRVSHKIEVKIAFLPQGQDVDRPIIYAAQWPVILPSCTCRWRSLKLPSYSKDDPSPLPYGVHETIHADLNAGMTYRGRLQSHLDQNDCSCGIAIEELLKFEDEYEEAQHTCLSELMSQEMLGDSAIELPAWEGSDSEEIQNNRQGTEIDLSAVPEEVER